MRHRRLIITQVDGNRDTTAGRPANGGVAAWCFLVNLPATVAAAGGGGSPDQTSLAGPFCRHLTQDPCNQDGDDHAP